jgi:protein tyrosine phosphatase (PTP) superfamily phosphohydrolase (DUF442 family)
MNKILELPLIVATFCAALQVLVTAANETTNAVAKSLEIPGVHNAFRVTDRIYSGSQPEGDASFAAIARLGVKTIVSVDGSIPEVEAARKHGLRYVHLPYGYDGIPTNRVVELAKLTTEVSGPFFVHCHHGLHRGPAAVAVMCEASEGWTTNRALEWLREAGTSPDYPGLYRSASRFKAPTRSELASAKAFQEITKPSSIVEAMVTIDEHFTWLKQSQKAGWKTPRGHADISPAHEAMMIWEQIKEIGRTGDTAKQTDDYRIKLSDAEQAMGSLHKLLYEPASVVSVDAAFKRAGQTCVACHKKYRNG